MLIQFFAKKNMRDLSSTSMMIDGTEVAQKIRGFTLDCSNPRELPQLVLFPILGEYDLAMDAEVHVVEPPSDADVFRKAAERVRSLDARAIETVALEKLQWESDQSVIAMSLEVIAEVFESAADELEADSEVRGSTDGGSGDSEKEQGND